ncbi:vitamin K epoxide reductase family protein [Tenacibaculum tangerinum]|uniref:Vitamin K epoxide reductase family protein n=1 Tax=Tenacibaculum tangerinum TaxID=3038772 RepID=A0ABY8L4W6_9FLAO|nr:vitamin K epoxide reductase family protein [Tenacibaculum tangerinum]WGH75238.1 vitamin K epoxide reductase family protein [Tenacibaculum tangerinum]
MDYHKITTLLKEYNYFIIKEDWDKSVKDHPDFPQLNSIADIFNQYGIDNYIAQVPKELFDDLPEIFIGMVDFDGSIETLIVNISDKSSINLIFFDSVSQVTKDEFLRIWNGYILVIEENEQTIDTPKKIIDFKPYFSKLLLLLVFISFSIMGYYFNFLNYKSASLLFINSLGIFLSFLAVKESLGFGNKHTFKVCSTIKNGNCNQVIKSESAHLFLGITYSDLSLIFFLFSFIISLFVKNHPEVLSLNFVILPLTIGVIILSIYQQKNILKKWCIICLGISFLALIQSLIIISSFEVNIITSFRSLFFSFFIYLLVFTLFYNVKPLLNKLSDLTFEKYQRGEIYKNKEVFDLFSKNEILIPKKDYEDLFSIKLNNIESKNTLTLVLSLDCSYCKSVYNSFRNLFFYYKNKVNFKVIFNFEKDKMDEHNIEIINRIYSFRHDVKKATQSLDEFLLMNYTSHKWLRKWKKKDSSFTEKILKNIEILESNNLTDTPCLLINNRLCPKEYRVEDIKYFLNSII